MVEPVNVRTQFSLEGSVSGATGNVVSGEDGGIVADGSGLSPEECLGQGLVGQTGLSHPVTRSRRGVVDVILHSARVLVFAPLKRLDLKNFKTVNDRFSGPIPPDDAIYFEKFISYKNKFGLLHEIVFYDFSLKN